jgi:hypothetical protein
MSLIAADERISEYAMARYSKSVIDRARLRIGGESDLIGIEDRRRGRTTPGFDTVPRIDRNEATRACHDRVLHVAQGPRPACESRTDVAVDAAGASVLVVFGRPGGQLCGVRLDSP